MGIKTMPHPPYSLDLAHCDFWLFPKLRGCRYEKIEEVKEAVMKVIDTLTQEDSMGPFRSCCNGVTSALQPEEITSKGTSFMCVLKNKSAHTKKVWKLIVSTSCHATCTDNLYPLSPLLPIVHCFWQVLRATSRILTYLLYYRFELVVLHFLSHMNGSIGVHHLWDRLCFSSSVLHVWFVYL